MSRFPLPGLGCGLLLSWVLLWGGACGASDRAPSSDMLVEHLQLGRAVSEEHLDRMRGGFVMPNGLRVDFGIERRVMLDDQEVYGLRLQYSGGEFSINGSGAASLSDARAVALNLPASIGQVTVAGSGLVLPALIIQNSLDGHAIRAVTTLQVEVNSLSVLRGQQLFESLRQAVGGKFGP